MAYVIGAACVDVMDRSCVEQCPVDCIYEGRRKLYINPAECIDCGACEATCPVEAITAQPSASANWLQDSVEFFDSVLPGRNPLGSPGGATGVGPAGADGPEVAAVPVHESADYPRSQQGGTP